MAFSKLEDRDGLPERKDRRSMKTITMTPTGFLFLPAYVLSIKNARRRIPVNLFSRSQWNR